MTDKLQERVNKYLDTLRESGVTNMYGAAPYIVTTFQVSKGKARKLLAGWMRTFDVRHPDGM